MIRKLLVITLILLLIPGSLVIWLITTESGLQWLYQRIQGNIPTSVSFKQLEGRLIGPVIISDFHYSDISADISGENAIIDWQPLSLLYGTLNINQLHVNTLHIKTKASEASNASSSSNEIKAPDLPLQIKLNDTRFSKISIDHQDKLQQIDELTLSASSGYKYIRIKKLKLKAQNSNLSVQGHINLDRLFSHNLNIKWKTISNDNIPVEAHGNIRGNLNTLQIQQNLQAPVNATLKAKIEQPLKNLIWESTITAKEITGSSINPEWPAFPVSLNIHANGSIQQANFKLEIADASNSKTPALGKLTLQGLVEPVNNLIKVKLESEHISAQKIDSKLTLKADIHPDSIDIQSLEIAALNGNTRIKGIINWAKNINWNIDIASSGIDPSVLVQQLPGKLDTSLNINGQLKNGIVSSQFNKIQLTGTLNNQPIKLNSKLRLDDTNLLIDRFKLTSGSSALNLNGIINHKIELAWNLNSASLAQLYPGLKGSLIANGNITGTRDKPYLQSSITSQHLGYQAYQAEKLNASIKYDMADYKKTAINLVANNISVNDQQIDTLSVELDSQKLITELTSETINSRIEFLGKLQPELIKGQLVKVNIDSSGFGKWTLDKPSQIIVDRSNIDNITINIENTCFNDSQTSTACFNLQRHINNWSATLQANAIDLALMDNKLPVDLQLRGKAQLDAKFELSDNRSMDASVQVQLNKGSIQQVISKRQSNQWQYNDGHLKLTIDDKGLQATSRINIQNNDSFKAQLAMPGFNPFTYNSQTQSVKANIELQMSDPGIIEATIPEPVDLEGKMVLNLQLAGYTANPQITGNININNGRLYIPRLGLNIENILLSSQNRPDNSIHYTLSAQSGEGKFKITGYNQFDIEAGFPGEMRIQGSDIEVSNIPEARVNASPDLKIKIRNKSIDIDGKIHIPYAKLQPKDISSAESISSDVVIIGEDTQENTPWVVTSSIRLSLGDRVSFYGFGFEGRFGGEVLLQDQPGHPTIATGTLTIPEGRYRAYGQRLDVEYGKLIYTGSPVNNPGLDIRAVRKINEVTAGLTIRGHLARPRIELFSSPAMGQSDILAYLILGGPIENASGEEGATMARAALALGLTGGDQLARRIGDRFGFDEMRVETNDSGDQASLVVGRYLSPKLYVSYGVGLVEALNSVRLRYQISSKWQLKVESGESHGADFLYTIER